MVPSAPQSITLPQPAGYSSSDVWAQSLAYASLLLSLFAAFGAILGKQWLGYYKSNRHGQGSLEERGRRRQQKMEALRTWYFDAVVQSFSALLQVSLFLFGTSLSINMWSQQQSIARVIICITLFGVTLYGFTVFASLMSSDCPFQTPVSVVIRIAWRLTGIRMVQFYESCHFKLRYAPRYIGLGVALGKSLLTGLTSARSMLSALRDRMVTSSCLRSIRTLRSRLSARFRAPVIRDLEFGKLPSKATESCLPVISLSYEFPPVSVASSDAPSVKWLLETSTDPNVFIAACHLVPEVEWPFDFDVSGIISLLHRGLESCFDTKDRLLAPAKERALACATALVHLSGREYLRLDGEYYSAAQCPSQPRYLHFWHLLSWESLDADYALKINLGQKWIADYTYRFFRDTPTFSSASDATLLWLSQVLPYVFLLHKDTDELAQMEDLALSIISMLLEAKIPNKAPSAQVLANCTLLAGILLGLNVDKTVLVKLIKGTPIILFPLDRLSDRDQSAAIDVLVTKLLACLQGCVDGTHPQHYASRAKKCLPHALRIIELTRAVPLDGSFFRAGLACCKEIFLECSVIFDNKTEDSEDMQKRLFEAGAALHTAICIPQGPLGSVYHPDDSFLYWYGEFTWTHDTRSSHEFNWLIDYVCELRELEGYEVEDTLADALLALSAMRSLGSRAKEAAYLEVLLWSMGPEQPARLRYAALRTTCESRKTLLAAIEDTDGYADLREKLLALSPAILTAISPSEDASVEGSHGVVFDEGRDGCYLKLLFALVKNPTWYSRLSQDDHMNRCISLMAEAADSNPHAFYLSGIFLRITAVSMSLELPLHDMFSRAKLSPLVPGAWDAFPSVYLSGNDDCVEILPALAELTLEYIPLDRFALETLDERIDWALDILRKYSEPQNVISAVETLLEVVRTRLNSPLVSI
ncbi:hypothetical protein EDB19DRAFT_673428 [Suillus lakei]|nr:hypothetical protein EDB19DRAFT_673428 [Suillus lakei]